MGGTLRVLFKQANLSKIEASFDAGAKPPRMAAPATTSRARSTCRSSRHSGRALVLYRQRTGGFVDDPSIGRYNMNSVMTTGGRLMLGFQPTSTAHQLHGHHPEADTGGSSLWAPSVGQYTSACASTRPPSTSRTSSRWTPSGTRRSARSRSPMAITAGTCARPTTTPTITARSPPPTAIAAC
jgi:hypothetical protein